MEFCSVYLKYIEFPIGASTLQRSLVVSFKPISAQVIISVSAETEKGNYFSTLEDKK